jgi:hypothetical protein
MGFEAELTNLNGLLSFQQEPPMVKHHQLFFFIVNMLIYVAKQDKFMVQAI